MFGVLLNRIKALFFIIVGLVKRSLCCFRRRRRISCDSEPLTNVGVISNYENKKKPEEMQNWNSWDDPISVVTDRTPNTVQHFIDMYRQQQITSKTEAETQADFFQDMTPRIVRQTKLFVKPESDEAECGETSSRLDFVQEDVLPNTELGTWEERENSGSWEEAEQWNTEEMVREKRKQERERRIAEQAKKRSDREHSRSLGSRLS